MLNVIMSTCDAWIYCSHYDTMRGNNINNLNQVRRKMRKYQSSSVHWDSEPDLELLCLWTSYERQQIPLLFNQSYLLLNHIILITKLINFSWVLCHL